MILREKKFSFIHTHTRLTFNFLLLLLCTYYDVNVQKQKKRIQQKKVHENSDIYSVLQDNQLKVKRLSCFQLFLIVLSISFPAIYQYTYCKTQTFKPVNYSLTRHFKGPGHRSHLKTLGSWILGPTWKVPGPECHLMILGPTSHRIS